MKRLVSIGLLSLFLCHILAHVLVLWTLNWQEESDLSSRLTVYRTVDSIVEFYIPLHERAANTVLPAQTTDGFAYRDSYFEIVRQEVKNDTLHILGYVNKKRSFWQQDLLGFIKHQFSNESGSSQKKADHLLKNLLKEYYTSRPIVMCFCHSHWRETSQIPSITAFLSNRAIPVHSPPPQA
ncbi:hypothetical protein GO755_08255 [Spirosoma sp. HMF4905]|uniref:Uncharacterized protein n=1 Tax=Spirosoma arboris TaxID=2682092 RepID=A0A7K1S867_9BACT|nr:hypothetical protein [Spirosoma arboris]MVM30021.1 hypothetical protein [Spirosoma arboris]